MIDTPSTKTQAELMATLGIESSQVTTTEPTKTTSLPTTEFGKLKAEGKRVVEQVNKDMGKNISFTCFVRKGGTKDNPKYVTSTKKGNWLVVARKDGLFDVHRVIYYSESFTIADFNELDLVQPPS